MSEPKKAGRPRKLAGEPNKNTLWRQDLVADRKCLCCQKMFQSEGPQNRMCIFCKDNYKGLEMGKLVF